MFCDGRDDGPSTAPDCLLQSRLESIVWVYRPRSPSADLCRLVARTADRSPARGTGSTSLSGHGTTPRRVFGELYQGQSTLFQSLGHAAVGTHNIIFTTTTAHRTSGLYRWYFAPSLADTTILHGDSRIKVSEKAWWTSFLFVLHAVCEYLERVDGWFL